MKPLILNASPLIFLAKVSLIGKVEHFHGEKYITRSIYREIVEEGKMSGKPEVFMIDDIIKKGIIKIKTPADKKYVNRLRENPKIHASDADILALARELNGVALMDDEEARGMAEIECIEHHGTIYLLIRMRKMRLLTKVETLAALNEMIRTGWRCSTERYAEILMALS